MSFLLNSIFIVLGGLSTLSVAQASELKPKDGVLKNAQAQSQEQTQGQDQSQIQELAKLQIFIFDGEELPKKKRVYIKRPALTDQLQTSVSARQEPQEESVLLGFKEMSLIGEKVQVALRSKGPFYELNLVPGRTSQISFDLSKEDEFLKKFDSFYQAVSLEEGQSLEKKGRVYSSSNGGPVKDATVFLIGSSISAKTDAQGRFKIRVPQKGKYKLSIVHRNFRIKNLNEVTQDSDLSLKLLPRMGEMEEFVVLAPKTKGSIEDLLKERKKNQNVSVYIGAEQFKKNGDSSAASALKRVSGLSLVEGKYVYIRGLGERYSSTTLNGARLPSPNPSRRVVPLDLFPTSLIESISIQKSYSSNLPAQFSAGLVEIRTLSIPKKKAFFKMAVSSGVSSDQVLAGTEEGFSHSQSNSRDYLGFDDGRRALPQEIQAVRDNKEEIKLGIYDFFEDKYTGFTPEQLSDLGNSLSTSYNLSEERVQPNLGMSLETGGRLKLGVHKAGLILKGAYKNTNGSQEYFQNSYVPNSQGLALNSSTRLLESERAYRLGGVSSFGLDFFKRHKLNIKALATRSTFDRSSIESKEAINNEEESFNTYRISWEEREILNLQIGGEHSLFENYKGPKLKWFWSRSLSGRYRPDEKEYRYYLASETYVDRSFGNQRIFSDLRDAATDLSLDLNYDFKALSWLQFKTSVGQRFFDKARRSSTQRFTLLKVGSGGDLSADPETLLSEENINNQTFRMQDDTLATDNYKARETNRASYVNLSTDFLFSEESSLSVITGVRFEDHIQESNIFNIVDQKDSTEIYKIEQDRPFYSYGLHYKINKKSSLRLAYSQTVSRPDLQEFSKVIYYNDRENSLEIGNPDLKISEIDNVDLRYDYYLNKKEFISLGIFSKNIKNPIESIDVLGSEDAITFKNIDGASNIGFEFELRKHLYKNLFLSGNYSYIDSQVRISQEDLADSTSSERPLQGQSPYLVNVGLEYSNQKIDTALIFNVAGKRISRLGSSGSPDIYDEPFNKLDFTLRYKLSKKRSISFRAQNLLDPLALRTQGGLPVRSFRRGRAYNLSLNFVI